MRKAIIVPILIVLVAVAAFVAWQRNRVEGGGDALTVYGNVEFRQAALAFVPTERIEAVLVEEGERVTAGQVLARVERPRLAARLAEAEASAAAQEAVVARLREGTRPEEIAQARAHVAAADAEVLNARQEHERLQSIAASFEGRAISEREVQDARAKLVTAEAALEVSRRGLALAEAGPRREEIAEAEARLAAARAQVQLQQQALADRELRAPADGVVRERLMEPGEMASPQRPVISLAVTDPKWIRAYVPETQLGRLRPGMAAAITIDTFPDRRYEGWIGFISPVAEFTPKPVQTETLRTSLVYEVRVFVGDAANELRLGMPATVHLEDRAAATTQSGNPTTRSGP